jgi:hypothetical protein
LCPPRDVKRPYGDWVYAEHQVCQSSERVEWERDLSNYKYGELLIYVTRVWSLTNFLTFLEREYEDDYWSMDRRVDREATAKAGKILG